MPSSQLESRLRYEFRNVELLRQALTHRSHSATHNERLEFLGDSVLNCAVAALLFQRFGKLDEGDLSRVRANLVKQQSLYEIAQALNISDSLRLGEGELRSGGFRRPSILADAFEAIIGAVFLDGGFEAAQGVIKRLYVPILDHIDPRTLGKDAKTLLQEYLQGHKIALPAYTVVATHGAAHNQQFEVECAVPKLDVKVSGSGASRRAAEQAAAKKALDEVMALAPMLAAKPKRSKSARGAKHVEPEIVPGVKGVQEALDLRSPERKERRVLANDAKGAEGKVAETKPAAETHALESKVAEARPAVEAKPAETKAADTKLADPKAADARSGEPKRDESKPLADAKGKTDAKAAEMQSGVHAGSAAAPADMPGSGADGGALRSPLAVIRAAHVEHGQDKTEARAAKAAEKVLPADKGADKAFDKVTDKASERATEKNDAAARPADRPARVRDPAHAPQAIDDPAAPVRVADAGH
ncbi:ribonuclease III [Burkholderia singularis]|uniref:Ribonuclease 3 n=1 Tax=Burkholderia singularis TaxID=1503053 RepID=A0A103DZ11_9BURK|nr:ribonuclease III [Burkholderia singularis]KVE25335.1 ribonuclease III [Burkholderia singularis]